MANRGYEGTTKRKFNYWGNDGADIVRNTRRGNEASGAMSGKGFNATYTAPTGPNVLSSDKRIGAAVVAPAAREATQSAAAATRMSNRADTQQAAYLANSKSGGTWSVKEFGEKMKKWNAMRSYGTPK